MYDLNTEQEWQVGCCDVDNDGYSGSDISYCGGDDCDDDASDDPADCPTDPANCDSTTSECAICINPGAAESCDSIDNDCDGQVDEGCDDDGDDYCDAEMEVVGTPGVCSNGGGDCDDTDPDINPSATETCDSLDNDCNGIIDDIETTPTRGRALGGPQSEDADAVETDEGFGVVWKQWNKTTLKWDVFFVETDKHGMPLIDPVMVSDPSSGPRPVMPSVAWDSANDVFAVAWDSRSDEEVYISLVDGSDYSATEPVMVSEDDGKKSILPEVEWSGSSFGVAWLDASKGAAYTTNLFFREVSADVSMQPIKQITAGDDARGFPEVEWNNDNGKYAVAWERDDYGSYGIMVTLFDADGSNTVSKDIFYEYGTQAMEPSITWNSERNEYALVWRDDRDDSYDLYFTRLAPDGEKLLPEVALTDDNSAQQFPSITWSSEAGEYGIAWMQDYGYFTRVVPERESILPGKRYQEFADMKVTKPTSWRPKLFHTGAAYRMVYSDDRARFIRLNDCGKRLNMTTKYLDIPKVANVYKAGMAFTGENVFNLAVYAGNDTTASYTNSGTFSDVADFRKQVNESVKSCDEDIGGTCKVPINIAADNGEVTVSSIDVGFTNYLWNTWLMPEGFNYRIKLIAEELPVCGNGKMEADEECDDGNVAGGDGCSGDCTIE